MDNQEVKKVVFLDFDGVIRVPPELKMVNWHEFEFCQHRMKSIAAICKDAGARIVVSSDWRNSSHGAKEEIEFELKPYLNELLHEDWMTPIIGTRWQEIQNWMLRHQEVHTYAILEDWVEHFKGAPSEMLDRLILCDTKHGVTSHELMKLMIKLSDK